MSYIHLQIFAALFVVAALGLIAGLMIGWAVS
jgi:hypothetical protein